MIRMPEALGGGVVAVHQRLAPAEKKHVRPPEMQRAPKRRLQPDPEPLHPVGARGRRPHHQSRQGLVGPPRRHAHEIGDVFLFRVGVGQEGCRRLVHRSKVARVAAVAAAKGPGRALDDDHRGAALARAQRRAQAGVAAAQHRDVELLSQSSP